jgi:hypothetical protein
VLLSMDTCLIVLLKSVVRRCRNHCTNCFVGCMYLRVVPRAFDRNIGRLLKAWNAGLIKCRFWTLFLLVSSPTLAEACRCSRTILEFVALGELFRAADVEVDQPKWRTGLCFLPQQCSARSRSWALRIAVVIGNPSQILSTSSMTQHASWLAPQPP